MASIILSAVLIRPSKYLFENLLFPRKEAVGVVSMLISVLDYLDIIIKRSA